MRQLTYAMACVMAACGVGCPQPIVQPADKPAGPIVINCEADDTCPAGQPTCAFGQCVRECQADAACDGLAGTFCSQRRVCEPGCRASAECTSGEVCLAGACVVSTGCGTKCDCAVGQVCRAGSCDQPPVSCTNVDDCARGPGDAAAPDQCSAYECDGFNRECVDRSPDPCTTTSDCTGRLGCDAGCTCTPNQQCVTDVACTVSTETTACAGGFYCDANLRCAPAPACLSQTDCPAALTCNLAVNQCARPQPCTSAADCTAVPATLCDTRVAPSFCAVPNCINLGITCNPPQVCAASGSCATPGTGAPCSTDGVCPSDQYCSVVGGVGACAVGCRDNGSCGGGQACDGSHACVGGGTLQGLNGSCADTSECEAGLVCSLNGACKESCEAFNTGECAGQAGCCALSASPCCNLFNQCSNGLNGTCL